MLYMSGGELAAVKLIQKYSVTVRYSLYDGGAQRSTKVIYSFHSLLFRNFQVVYNILMTIVNLLDEVHTNSSCNTSVLKAKSAR